MYILWCLQCSKLDFDFFISILLIRESDGGAKHRANPVSRRSCPCFRVFRLKFAFNFFNLPLVRFHQAEIIVVKHLIQGRNNEAWVGVETSTLRCIKNSFHFYVFQYRLEDPKPEGTRKNFAQLFTQFFIWLKCDTI